MPFIGLLSGGIAGLGSVASGALEASASEYAAQTQAQSAAQALAFQEQIWGQEQQNLAPFLGTGSAALGQLWGELPGLTAPFSPANFGLPSTFSATGAGLPSQFSYSPSQVLQDPAYQFALGQGEKAISQSAAARGTAGGSSLPVALDQFATGTAQQYYGQDEGIAQSQYQQNYGNALSAYQQNYGNAFNTFQANQSNTYNRLAGIANLGLEATGQFNQAGQTFGNSAGNASENIGNALAGGIVGSTNALTGGFNNASNSFQNALLLQQILGGGGLGGVSGAIPAAGAAQSSAALTSAINDITGSQSGYQPIAPPPPVG
jgi:hypothetical protein